jgi:hypothetical protein
MLQFRFFPVPLSLLLGLAVPLAAGGQATALAGGRDSSDLLRPSPAERTLVEGTALSDEADRVRREAEAAAGLRILVSLSERRLWLKDGTITLHSAPAAIGKGGVLEHDGRSWSFDTPRGVRRVVAREVHPEWIPPLWHYVELARERGFHLAELRPGQTEPLPDGSRLLVRGEQIVLFRADGQREVLPPREEIVFGGTLYVPPLGAANRRIAGELGRYKLDLGDGYLIHATPDQRSVGSAATHGCLRLRADDLELLYGGVSLGTPVYIY